MDGTIRLVNQATNSTVTVPGAMSSSGASIAATGNVLFLSWVDNGGSLHVISTTDTSQWSGHVVLGYGFAKKIPAFCAHSLDGYTVQLFVILNDVNQFTNVWNSSDGTSWRILAVTSDMPTDNALSVVSHKGEINRESVRELVVAWSAPVTSAISVRSFIGTSFGTIRSVPAPGGNPALATGLNMSVLLAQRNSNSGVSFRLSGFDGLTFNSTTFNPAGVTTAGKPAPYQVRVGASGQSAKLLWVGTTSTRPLNYDTFSFSLRGPRTQ
jgi:hypothetical protein